MIFLNKILKIKLTRIKFLVGYLIVSVLLVFLGLYDFGFGISLEPPGLIDDGQTFNLSEYNFINFNWKKYFTVYLLFLPIISFRLNDIGITKWCSLMFLIPLHSYVFTLWLLFYPGIKSRD